MYRLQLLFIVFLLAFYFSPAILYIQAAGRTMNRTPLRSSIGKPAYAPDRIIVKFKKGQSKKTLMDQAGIGTSDQSAEVNSARQNDAVNRPKQRFDQMLELERRFGIFLKPITKDPAEDTVVALSTTKSAIDVDQAVRAYQKLPEVAFAQPDYVYQALEVPNDPLYTYQWYIRSVRADLGWDIAAGNNQQVVIAILDSGISQTHPDLLANNIVSEAVDCTTPISGCVPGGGDMINHGTAVAGVASAVVNNNVGIAGTGYGAKFYSVKVLDDLGFGYDSTLVYGINHAVQSAGGRKLIINLSLGTDYQSPIIEDAVNYAWSNGALLVAAAGNFALELDPYMNVYPAAYPNVIGVTAVSYAQQIAPYANRGTWVDLAAPGGDCSEADVSGCILTTDYMPDLVPDNYYAWYMGTSFSAPIVSGIAALVWSKNTALTNEQVRSILQNTAGPIAGTGSYWQYGMVDARLAIEGAVTISSTPAPNLSPTGKEGPVGDLNGDGRVSIADLSMLLSAFGASGTQLPADINKNGVVDIADLSQLLAHYGT